MNHKFNIGDNVLVVYANDKTKVGRVESICMDMTDKFKGKFTFCPSYKISIEGNKRFKKCFEFELKPMVDETKKVGEEEKPTKQKYNVHYSFYLSDSIEVEAESEREAEEIVDQMICAGEIGNLNEMDVGDQKIWCD